MPTNTELFLPGGDYLNAFIKGAILLILFFYLIFSLIIVRQTQLMSKTLITNISALVRGIAIINVGLAVGLIVLAWGVL